MLFYQKALANFIASELNENTKGIVFDAVLYNNIGNDDNEVETPITDSYATEITREVPTIISGINGEYIPVPSIDATNNSVELQFNLLVDNLEGLPVEDVGVPADYNNTLLAIDEFRANVLANYFPLGTSNLLFGGEDSELELDGGVSAYSLPTIYMELNFKNIDVETIFITNGTKVKKLSKTATKLQFHVDSVLMAEIDYTINTATSLIIYYNTTTTFWTLSDGTNSNTQSVTALNTTMNNIVIGDTTGYEGVLERFLADTDTLTLAEAENAVSGNIDTEIPTPVVDFNSFSSKNTMINKGSGAWTGEGTNIVLWGSEGNAVFQVYPLTTIGNFESQDGFNYHAFTLQLEVLVTDNVMFGNNFEYYIDDIQVFPVDRNHTYGMETQPRQAISVNQMSFIGSESSLEWSQSFFYTPTKQMNGLLKKITTGDVDQNTVYSLKVQYPFWNKTYNVIVEGGGINTDLNSISAFTLKFKLADSIIVS